MLGVIRHNMQDGKHTLATALMIVRDEVPQDVFASLVAHIDELTHLATTISDPINWRRVEYGEFGKASLWKGPGDVSDLAQKSLDSLQKPI